MRNSHDICVGGDGVCASESLIGSALAVAPLEITSAIDTNEELRKFKMGDGWLNLKSL